MKVTDCRGCGHTYRGGTHHDNVGGPGDKGCDVIVTRNGGLERCGCQASPPRIVAIRAPATDSERDYVRSSWIEAYRYAPGMSRMTFRAYRMMETGWLEHALARPDTQVLVAMLGDAIAGWVAYCPRPTVDVVHWVQTRYRIGRDGEHLRRRGIMAQLLEAAKLKRRVAYTFLGSLPRHTEQDQPRVSSDVWISRWLADRANITAVYKPYREWIR